MKRITPPAEQPKVEQLKAIDCWLNPNLPQPSGTDLQVEYLFKDYADRVRKGATLRGLLEEMDLAGIERAILTLNYGDENQTRKWALDAIDKYPERFIGSVIVDPHKGMGAVRELESLVRNYQVRLARVLAVWTGRPYNDRIYYPIYSKCIELSIPISCNVGIPGPRLPGIVQDPASLDEVCWFFPELKVVMAHGGEPWADMCVKLMLKWDNLFYMSSAFAPRHLPKAVVEFMKTRGAHKVLFATDYPLLSLKRCIDEVAQLNLESQDQRAFLFDNAANLFDWQVRVDDATT